MEAAATENAATPVVVGVADLEAAGARDQPVEGATVEDGKHKNTEVHVDVTHEEMRSIIEVIADTGKFWHDWGFLKGLLSLQMKQALAGYSEEKVISQENEQQHGLLGEAYSELVNRLTDALWRFEEGPPFTLQRLCENLLVTSTMTKCTDPYPAAHGGPTCSEGAQIADNIGAPVVVDVEPESMPEPTGAESNRTEHRGGYGDEEMADAEPEEVPCSHDVEMEEGKPDQVLSVNPDANPDATAVPTETVNVNEPSSNPQS